MVVGASSGHCQRDMGRGRLKRRRGSRRERVNSGSPSSQSERVVPLSCPLSPVWIRLFALSIGELSPAFDTAVSNKDSDADVRALRRVLDGIVLCCAIRYSLYYCKISAKDIT